MKNLKYNIQKLHSFILLWSSQSLSGLGSSMTSFALILWSYEQHGSALLTSLLSICTYAPYVVLSIFTGTISDKWNKKVTMLFCDGMAAVTTILILILFKMNQLEIWHLYAVNIINGIMNSLQQPASDVTITLLTPKDLFQQVSSMRSFSNSLVTILVPVIASSLYSLLGMEAVLFFDLTTFMIAWIVLIFFIKIPAVVTPFDTDESFWKSSKQGLTYLLKHRGILDLILFLAMINLSASMYQAALPAMLLSRSNGGDAVLGLVNACSGLANLVGSVYLLFSKPPKSRVKTICNALLFSMMSENLILALGNQPWMWCVGAVLGWITIPVMNTNLDVLLRTTIPVEIQGRVYAARNTLQFFTIPLGYFLGGYLIDIIFEPLMVQQETKSILVALFGSGKGSGAAMLFMLIAFLGILTCLIFRVDKHIWQLEKNN